MSYYQAKKSYEDKNTKPDEVVYTCSVCLMGADKLDLMRYGARCWKCYDEYCKSAPRHPYKQNPDEIL